MTDSQSLSTSSNRTSSGALIASAQHVTATLPMPISSSIQLQNKNHEPFTMNDVNSLSIFTSLCFIAKNGINCFNLTYHRLFNVHLIVQI